MTVDRVQELVAAFPTQLLRGLAAAEGIRRYSAERRPKPSVLVTCGMGGSALPGLLLEHLAPSWRIRTPIIVHRNYGLPKTLRTGTARPSAKPLVLCISYSGNTEETLSAYEEARRRRFPLTVIASGGTIAEWAERDGVLLTRIPGDVPPRFGVSYQFGALVGVLAGLRILSPKAAAELRRAARSLTPLRFRSSARRSAEILRNRIPVIYAAEEDAALAYVLKIQINENAKVPAFLHVFPELNHNELNTYANLSPKQRGLRKTIASVILEQPAALPEIRARMRVTASIIRDAGVPLARIAAPRGTPLLRMLSVIIFGEWLSTDLASSYGIDPLPTELIERFKVRLAAQRRKLHGAR